MFNTDKLEENKDFRVMNYIPQPIIVLDKNNYIKFINKSAKDIFHNINIEEKVENIVNGFNKEFTNRRQCCEEKKIKASILTNYGERYYDITLSETFDDDGEIIDKTISFYDFTEYKFKEDKFEKERAEAVEESLIRYRFISNTSYEIRTYINGIMGMTDLSLMSDLNMELKENLNLIKSSTFKLLDMSNNIVDFCNIQCGNLKLENVEFNFVEFMNEIVKENTVKCIEKKIEFKSKIDSSIPGTLIGDPLKIKKVLDNLLSNALKFTKEGAIKLNVEKVSDIDKGIKIKVNIEDTGIGIDKKHLPIIFNNFTQITNKEYTKKYTGTGLGLCISKGLVDMMGGDIYVNSKKNVGSTFTFEIILDKSKKYSNLTFIDKKQSLNDIDKINKRLNLLIVEDDKASQMVLKNLFSKKGHICDIANNGEEAVKMASNRPYDLILMDIQMPVMDGVQATKLIRKSKYNKEKHIPIIALTAYALKEDKEKFLGVGMDNYISKPFKVKELLQTVYDTVKDDESYNNFFNKKNNTTGDQLFLYLL